jgi:hypothetical protein
MFDRSPSDRMQPQELGELQPPGVCSVCGNGTCIDGYINLDIWIEYYGQVYLCNNCIRQAIEVWGGLVPEEAKHLQETNETLATQNAELKERNELLSNRLRIFDSAVLDAATGAGFGPISEQVSDGPERINDGPPNAAGSGESESEESVKVERPSDTTESTVRDGSTLTL